MQRSRCILTRVPDSLSQSTSGAEHRYMQAHGLDALGVEQTGRTVINEVSRRLRGVNLF